MFLDHRGFSFALYSCRVIRVMLQLDPVLVDQHNHTGMHAYDTNTCFSLGAQLHEFRAASERYPMLLHAHDAVSRRHSR